MVNAEFPDPVAQVDVARSPPVPTTTQGVPAEPSELIVRLPEKVPFPPTAKVETGEEVPTPTFPLDITRNNEAKEEDATSNNVAAGAVVVPLTVNSAFGVVDPTP